MVLESTAEVSAHRWVRPEDQQTAVRKARDRANAARWNLDTALFLFAVLAAVLILSFEKIDILVTAFVAITGLAVVWVMGWRRGKQAYPRFLEEELEQCAEDWKDYYKTLHLSPRSNAKAVSGAHKQLMRIYRRALSEEAQRFPLYAEMLKDIEEAYRALSVPASREAYDRVYWLRVNQSNVVIDEPTKNEFVELSEAIGRLVTRGAGKLGRRLPRPSRATQRVISTSAISLAVFITSGTTLAFANPEYPLAFPFKGVAVTVAKASGGAIGLLEDVRSIAALYERGIISTALQSMRIEVNLKGVPAVTESTNDMAVFPSAEYPLFPDYLDRQFSQFRYTVDSKGIIDVDASTATTDYMTERIRRMIERLEAGQ